ncbi:alpha/beta hydrolase [Pseudoroseicyclus sp. CXY001]|uniref:alpha/beta hydrolase n=1 Tax=Pseudoroseicyclus sp. CXY001 TaxID=3242492 RepID=UPI00358DC637
MDEVERRDFTVKTRDGVTIAVREVKARGAEAGQPIILLHGTRVPGFSEYDLKVAGGSLAEDLARLGHPSYIVDARGFGLSERPAEMEEPPVPGAPSLVRTVEITKDLEAAALAIRERCGVQKVAVFGWGVGGTAAIMFAGIEPQLCSHIFLYDTIYGGGGTYGSGPGSRFEDPERPGWFNKQVNGNYNYNSIDLLEEHWDRQVPIDDKDAWRDPAMVKAFSQALLDGDPTSYDRDPPTYRSPNGMLEDLFYMAAGERLFHANQVYCKVFIINPELDTLCQDSDMEVLIADLKNAEDVVHYNPPNTTHYLILDRPDRGRSELLARMADYLR